MEECKEFVELVRPIIKWLADNHNPHTSVIITNTGAEVVSGIMSTGDILDYIKD